MWKKVVVGTRGLGSNLVREKVGTVDGCHGRSEAGLSLVFIVDWLELAIVT